MTLLEALLGHLSQSPAASPEASAQALYPNAALENQVAPTDYPVNPLVLALAKRSGVMNVIRNARNDRQASVNDILGQP